MGRQEPVPLSRPDGVRDGAPQENAVIQKKVGHEDRDRDGDERFSAEPSLRPRRPHFPDLKRDFDLPAFDLHFVGIDGRPGR